ncbi:uncharacterized protein LOC143260962 [Megalopta genalis]|uniref:uncharacterized protein LOC143260962 n=1 Tax=Megalopta genalis TaxID=115081 RepID=UPI003FD1B39B
MEVTSEMDKVTDTATEETSATGRATAAAEESSATETATAAAEESSATETATAAAETSSAPPTATAVAGNSEESLDSILTRQREIAAAYESGRASQWRNILGQLARGVARPNLANLVAANRELKKLLRTTMYGPLKRGKKRKGRGGRGGRGGKGGRGGRGGGVGEALAANVTLIQNRYGRERQKTKPQIINSYNNYMGGVDESDKMLYTYLDERRTVKYWKKVTFNIFTRMVLNSYLLYKETVGREAMSRLQYISNIISEIEHEWLGTRENELKT